MRILTILLLFVASFAWGQNGQIIRGYGVILTNTEPTFTPPSSGSWLAKVKDTGKWYEWEWEQTEWLPIGDRIVETEEHGAPSYTPNTVQGNFAINLGDSLYHWNVSWNLLTPDLTGYVEWPDTLTYIATKQDVADIDLSPYVLYSDSNTVFVTPSQLGDSLAAIDLSPYVEYSDSNTIYVTPDQLSDSLSALPDSIMSGYGVAGYLPQYITPTKFDTTGVYWDATTGRLGIRQTSPIGTVDVLSPGTTSSTVALNVSNSSRTLVYARDDGRVVLGSNTTPDSGIQLGLAGSSTANARGAAFTTDFKTLSFGIASNIYGVYAYKYGSGAGPQPLTLNQFGGNVGVYTQSPTARLHVQGEGTTSPTTALLVENSAGTDMWLQRDDQVLFNYNKRMDWRAPTNSIGIGNNALTAEDQGSASRYNVAIGLDALTNTTTGGANVGLGFYALRNNVTGNDNLAIGSESLRLNTGTNNIGIGSTTMRDKTSGNNNVAIGVLAGFYTDPGVAITNSSNSVFIGYDTRPLANSQTNQNVIGYLSRGLGSNTTRIGNTSTIQTHLDGSLTLGSTTPSASALLTMTSTTQGLLPPRLTTAERDAIPSPALGLQLVSTTDSLPYFYNGTSYIPMAGFPDSILTGYGTSNYIPKYTGLGTLGNSIMYETGGKIGIANTSPQYKLDVYGTAATDGIRTNMGLDFYKVPNPNQATNFLTLTPVAGSELEVGTYYYRITFYNAIGETSASGVNAVTTTLGNERVQISNIPISADPTVIGRKIYRGRVGWGTVYGYLIATISDNTTTSYLDQIPEDVSKAQINWPIYLKPNRTNNLITIDGVKNIEVDPNLTVFGYNAGANALVSNTFFGFECGLYTTNGLNNTFIGYQAGRANTFGYTNVAIGDKPLGLNTGGINNVAIGTSAMYSTSGSSNVAIGYNNGAQSTSSSYNTLIGSHIAYIGNLGSQNIGLGAFAGFPVATGSNQLNIGNVIFGTQVGITTPMPTGRIGIRQTTPTATLHITGEGTTNLTTALLVENSAGTDIISANDEGGILLQGTITAGLGGGAITSNTAFGASALGLNTSGILCVGVGSQALYSNTTGNFNFGIGANALFSNQTGTSNTAIGTNSLFATTGSNNVGIGGSAALANTSGGNNIAVGVQSLLSTTNTSHNIGIGTLAGAYHTSATANQTPSNSIYIGYRTKAAGAGQSNQIVIGYDGIGLGSNTTRIGNSSTTQTHLDGSLTLGSTTPAASALLTMTSTTQGLLPPRLTTAQRDAIASPALGLQLVNITDSLPYFWNGLGYVPMVSDDWGSQVVEIDFGLSGDGTTGNELEVDSSVVATVYALQDTAAAIRTDFPETDLTIGGSGPTYTIESSTGADVTISAAGIATLSEPSANELRITATEVDGSTTNELQDLTIGGSGPTYTIDISNGADVTIRSGSGITLSEGTPNVLEVATTLTLDAGTYVPTLTNTTNIASSTAHGFQYMRVGSTVTVSGQVTVAATVANSATILELTIPVASNFLNDHELAGTGCGITTNNRVMAVQAQTTNDRAYVSWQPAATGDILYSIHFTYQIL